MVHIASNILRVREKFFSNEEITKLVKKKYENRRLTSLALMDIHRVIAVDDDEVAKIVFSASPQENQSKKLSISII